MLVFIDESAIAALGWKRGHHRSLSLRWWPSAILHRHAPPMPPLKPQPLA
jgi:hypothetical protein